MDIHHIPTNDPNKTDVEWDIEDFETLNTGDHPNTRSSLMVDARDQAGCRTMIDLQGATIFSNKNKHNASGWVFGYQVSAHRSLQASQM